MQFGVPGHIRWTQSAKHCPTSQGQSSGPGWPPFSRHRQFCSAAASRADAFNPMHATAVIKRNETRNRRIRSVTVSPIQGPYSRPGRSSDSGRSRRHARSGSPRADKRTCRSGTYSGICPQRDNTIGVLRSPELTDTAAPSRRGTASVSGSVDRAWRSVFSFRGTRTPYRRSSDRRHRCTPLRDGGSRRTRRYRTMWRRMCCESRRRRHSTNRAREFHRNYGKRVSAGPLVRHSRRALGPRLQSPHRR